jgi:GTP-binding protein HflX
MLKVSSKENVILVVLDVGVSSDWDAKSLMQELKVLALSCGANVVGEVTCKKAAPDAAYFVGKGKVEEVAAMANELNVDAVIFNESLSHAQVANLEKKIFCRVIDRTQLILDIFALRAKSTEGKIQVELAQLQYLLPRLAGKGQALSRLGGGIGTRGPGEQKLEVDRRRIKQKILSLKKNLAKIDKRRANRRERRKRKGIPVIALVGYTNSGKSTLLNSLTNATQLAENRLFSTLDPKVNYLQLPNNQKVLLSDTVGFLHDLPHQLIESFKATLEEVVEADILIHVLDISNQRADELKKSVYNVLGELKALNKPIITALNKIDKMGEGKNLDSYLKRYENSVGISALKKTNLENLSYLIQDSLSSSRTLIKKLIPHSQMRLISAIRRQGRVFKEKYGLRGVYVEAEVPAVLAAKLEK